LQLVYTFGPVRAPLYRLQLTLEWICKFSILSAFPFRVQERTVATSR
jgi:hypothetical protein